MDQVEDKETILSLSLQFIQKSTTSQLLINSPFVIHYFYSLCAIIPQ